MSGCETDEDTSTEDETDEPDTLESADDEQPVDTDNDVEEHSAVVGCYMTNVQTGTIYGVTNKHVTLHAKDNVHIKTIYGQKIRFGQALHVQDAKSQDVELIEIDQDIQNYVSNEFIAESGKHQVLELYDGPINDTFGQTIVKCKPDVSNIKVQNFQTTNRGTVLSLDEHLKLVDTNLTDQFIVRGNGGVFAMEGESGTAVAIESGGTNKLKVIGIIGGRSGDFICCVYLPTVIATMKKVRGISLELCSTKQITETDMAYTERTSQTVGCELKVSSIPCGITIFVDVVKLTKTPDQIAPYQINLKEHAIYYTGYRFDEFDVKPHIEALKHELKLKELINNRDTLNDHSVFENDNPDYNAVENYLKACDCLYSASKHEAKQYLQIAFSCIIKSGFMQLRLFAKLLTYIIWYIHDFDENETMKVVLQEGIDFCEDNWEKEGFPRETVGYLLYYFSRYNQKRYDRSRSLDARNEVYESRLRRKSVIDMKLAEQTIQRIYDDDAVKSEDMLELLVNGKCELAYCLLGCGQDFNVIDGEVDVGSIVEADGILKDIQKGQMHKSSVILYAEYLLTKCDLFYRKGELKKALLVAKKCRNICDVGTGYKEVAEAAEARINKLHAQSAGDIKKHYFKVKLLEQGHQVLGNECADLACKQFFEEHNIPYKSEPLPAIDGTLYTATDGKPIKIYRCDCFLLSSKLCGQFDCIWDRGGFVALPVNDRIRYANTIQALLGDNSRYLLDCFLLDNQVFGGPPFHCSNDDVKKAFGKYCRIEKLEEKDVFGKWQESWGIKSFVEELYLLQPK